MPDVIRQRRAELGLSQAELAAKAGVDTRQIRRYEAGEQQPVLSVAAAIAHALGIPLSELAGMHDHGTDLSGNWWASWQVSAPGPETTTTQQVRLAQKTDLIQWEALTRGTEGGHLWRGELRLWDHEILTGWHSATDSAADSIVSVYLVVLPNGASIHGRWVGLGNDRTVVTGWGALAREQQDLQLLITDLARSRGPAE